MAEAQAQNKLGELFVDIGVGGLGKTLKALNSVSASFLLTKNAAQQAVTPLLNMTKEGASLATTLSKISAATGLAETKLLALKRVEILNTIEANTLINTLEGLQQKILGAKFNLDQNAVNAFTLMGLDPFRLSEKDPIKAFDEIKKRVETLSPEVQTMALNLLGMNKELTYVYKQLNGSLEENVNRAEQQYKVSEEQLKNLQEQQKFFNKIKVATEQIKINIAGWKFSQEIIKTVADMMTIIAQKGFIEGGKDIIEDIDKRSAEKQKENRDAFYNRFIDRTPTMEKRRQAEEHINLKRPGEYSLPLKYDEEERKKIQKEIKAQEQAVAKTEQIYQEEAAKYFKKKQDDIANVNAKIQAHEALGAKQLNVPNGVDNSLPTLPNAAATTNNNSSTVNITNYWNNQFEWIKEPEDMIQAADKLADQMGLSEYTNTSNI